MQKSLAMLRNICLSQMRRSNDPDMAIYTDFWLNEEYMAFVAENDIAAYNTRFAVDLTTAVQPDLTTFQEFQAPCDIIKLLSCEILIAATATIKASHKPMTILSLGEFERMFRGKNPADDSAGEPLYIALRRVEGIRSETIGLSKWTIESTDAADEGEFTFIAYDLATKQTISKVVGSLTGTTAVEIGGASARYYEAISCSKVGGTRGNVILKRADTATPTAFTNVAEILPWEVSCSYSVFQTYPYADKTYSLRGLCKRRPPMMSSNSDIPFGVPDMALEILIQGTVSKGLQLIEDADWATAEQKKEKAKMDYYRSLRGQGEDQEPAHVVFG